MPLRFQLSKLPLMITVRLHIDIKAQASRTERTSPIPCQLRTGPHYQFLPRRLYTLQDTVTQAGIKRKPLARGIQHSKLRDCPQNNASSRQRPFDEEGPNSPSPTKSNAPSPEPELQRPQLHLITPTTPCSMRWFNL